MRGFAFCQSTSPGSTFSAGLTCHYADGSSADVPFTSRQDLLTLHQQAREAWHRGTGTVDFHGKSSSSMHRLYKPSMSWRPRFCLHQRRIRKSRHLKGATCLSIATKIILSTQKTLVVKPLSPASHSRRPSNRMWYSKTINVLGWRGYSAIYIWAVGVVSWLTTWVLARHSRCLRSWPGSSNRALCLLRIRR